MSQRWPHLVGLEQRGSAVILCMWLMMLTTDAIVCLYIVSYACLDSGLHVWILYNNYALCMSGYAIYCIIMHVWILYNMLYIVSYYACLDLYLRMCVYSGVTTPKTGLQWQQPFLELVLACMHAQSTTHEELLGPLKNQLSTFLAAFEKVLIFVVKLLMYNQFYL